jgi:transcription elongation GreA/GreB family factor
MSRTKDMWLDEQERIAAQLEEAGMDPDRAYDLASNSAYDAARDRLADMADHARQRAKDAS